MKKVTIVILFFIMTAAIFAVQNKANEYNNQGMAAYGKKQYAEAARWFKKAIAADPNHKYAQYNLACAYALTKGVCGMLEDTNGNPLDDNPSNDIIYKQLEVAIKVDPTVKARILTDRDFDKVKDDIPFLELAGALPDKKDNEGWRKILLKRERWYIHQCGGGAYGCSSFTFTKKGTFIYYNAGHMCIDDVNCVNEESKEVKGTYEVQNGNVILKFDSGVTEIYHFQGQGDHTTDKKELLENNPDPCSA